VFLHFIQSMLLAYIDSIEPVVASVPACLRRSILYEDPDFPAKDSSIYYSRTLPYRIEWKRPYVSLSTICAHLAY
jgi:hypothetical protein